MKSTLSLFIFLLFAVDTFTQEPSDTALPATAPDSGFVIAPLPTASDSPKSINAVSPKDTAFSTARQVDFYTEILPLHPYYNFSGKPRSPGDQKRSVHGKDGLFYFLTGVLLYFALVKLLFGKYMQNLFFVFFRVSLKQKQIREQLLQNPLPSLLLNIFFILAGGIYVSFLLQHYKFVPHANIWLVMLYSVLALAVIYIAKFVVLKVMGWIFNIREATDTYIFVVFLVNKFLGMALLPFVILLAFTDAALLNTVIILSFTLVAVLFAYRYIISYAPVRKEIKVRQFHFVLYLCAFEIIPLLLIYKLLLNFFQRSY